MTFHLGKSVFWRTSVNVKSTQGVQLWELYNGNCIGFNGNYNGVYWYVVDSVGGMLNPIGKMPKTQ